MTAGRLRVLVTGFGSFPGVPANPTEELVQASAARAQTLSEAELHYALLPVEYQALPARLAAIGREFTPDVALHYGVSRSATAVTLERTARNLCCTVKPDNARYVPAAAIIHEGAETLPSSLPLEAMADALKRCGLPACVSDDAGDYLCNYLFYLSRSGQIPSFAPGYAGFIHVPLFGARMDDGQSFDRAKLLLAADTILKACLKQIAA